MRIERAIACVCLMAATVQLAAQAPLSQEALPRETFEVASVRRAVPGAGGSGLINSVFIKGDRWLAEAVTLPFLIQYAFSPDFQLPGQIAGGPGWLHTDRFTITANIEGTPDPVRVRRMVQALLMDRFQLVTHRERREQPELTMTVARADGTLGRAMMPIGKKCQQLNGAPRACFTSMSFGNSVRIQSGRMTMAELASTLGRIVGRTVIDQTGLTEPYALSLEFARDPSFVNPAFGGPGPVAGASAVFLSDAPALRDAMQRGLGLRLDDDRGPSDVLVIDRAEPPTPD